MKSDEPSYSFWLKIAQLSALRQELEPLGVGGEKGRLVSLSLRVSTDCRKRAGAAVQEARDISQLCDEVRGGPHGELLRIWPQHALKPLQPVATKKIDENWHSAKEADESDRTDGVDDVVQP